MKGFLKLIAVLLGAAINVQASIAGEPLPYTCSLVLRSEATQEPALEELFAQQSDVSGAYVCLDNFTGRLAWFNEAYGPFRPRGVAFFRLSEVSTIVMTAEYPTVEPLRLGLLVCLDSAQHCSRKGDYATVTYGVHEADLPHFSNLWDEIVRRSSTDDLILPGITQDSSLKLTGIFVESGETSAGFVVEDRRGNQFTVYLRVDVVGFQVVTAP